MLSNNVFYWGSIRSTIVAFGTLFSNIMIKRENADKSVSQTIAVPIAMSSKEKWLVRLEQDPTTDTNTYINLPRMAFEITGITYDSSRKVPKANYLTCNNGDDTLSKIMAPVPYNINISLYILSKTMEDYLQIVEQILPYFSPEFTLSIKGIPEMNINLDVPVVLNNTSLQDDYDGDFQTRRFVTGTLDFTLQTSIFGPISNQGIIKRVLVDVRNMTGRIDIPEDNNLMAHLDMVGDVDTREITYTWTEY